MRDTIILIILTCLLVLFVTFLVVGALVQTGENALLTEAKIIFPKLSPRLVESNFGIKYCFVEMETPYGLALEYCDKFKGALIRGAE